MKYLIKANHYIEEIAAQHSQITPITFADYSLFQSFFAKERHTYGNSWTYITQGMYGIGENNLGFKYYDGENLSAICIYPKIEQPDIHVFYWIRPMGRTILDIIDRLAKEFLQKYNIPTYVKKIFPEQFSYLQKKGFRDTSGFPWHSSCPSEDDTYPEQILDIHHTIQTAKKLGKTRQLNRSYRYYLNLANEKDLQTGSIFDHQQEIKSILMSFFQSKNQALDISDPYDFYNLFVNKMSQQTILEKIIFIDKTPLAFYFAEIQDKQYASQYALISLREISNHIADYLMFDMFESLRARNIKYLNLGGSEKESLDAFKKKYRPVIENRMSWAALYK